MPEIMRGRAGRDLVFLVLSHVLVINLDDSLELVVRSGGMHLLSILLDKNIVFVELLPAVSFPVASLLQASLLLLVLPLPEHIGDNGRNNRCPGAVGLCALMDDLPFCVCRGF